MQSQTALVTATFSRRMQLRLPQGDEVIARIKGRRLKPVCGDRVMAEPIDKESDWLITSIADRDNELSRPDGRGTVEVLAANIELLVAVIADLPQPDWFIVDRYLCAAELMGAAGAVVFNKIDLGQPDRTADAALREYAQIGYATARCSATTGERIDELASILNARTAIIVGQSGVGKSSLINALTGRKSLARISRSPGRTQQLNFFSLGGRLMLADLPGYGYAKAPKGEVKRWTEVVEAYLRGRAALRRTCLLIDARHGIRDSDRAVMAVLDQAAVSYQAVLTKCDKVTEQGLGRLVEEIERELAAHAAAHPQVLPTSARSGHGIPELRAALAALAAPGAVP